MTAAFLPAMIGVAALLSAGAACALVLRLARIPGGALAAAVGGGILAGVLLGPSVAWRAAPDWSGAYLRGGAEARQTLLLHRQQTKRELMAMEAGSADRDARERRADELRSEEERLQRRAEALRQIELNARVWIGLIVLSVSLALAGWVANRPRGGALLRPEAQIRVTLPAMLLPGATMSLMAALLAAVILRWAAGPGLAAPAILAIGGAFGAGAIFGPLRIRGRRVGPAADRLGMMCLIVSTGLIFVASIQVAEARPGAIALPAGALAMGWGAGLIFSGVRPGPSRRARTVAREALLVVAMPGAVALAAAQIDLSAVTGALAAAGSGGGVGGGGWRPIVAIAALAMLAGAGQVAGAWLGLLAAGHNARPMRTALEANCGGLGALQATGALILLAVGVVEPWTAAGSVALTALLLSGLMLELSAPATLRMWREMEAAEFVKDEG